MHLDALSKNDAMQIKKQRMEEDRGPHRRDDQNATIAEWNLSEPSVEILRFFFSIPKYSQAGIVRCSFWLVVLDVLTCSCFLLDKLGLWVVQLLLYIVIVFCFLITYNH